MYKGIFYNNNKWRHGIFSYESVADVIAFAGHNMKYTVKFTDDDFAPLMELKTNSEEPTSYMNPQGYVDPTSKYYIDRMWEEYHKVKNDLAAVRIEASSAWQEYRKMKEELADTKSKLGQMDDYVNEVLKPELADAKLKLKMAHSAWDELDKSHAERAKLHDELVIAEGQRDQWKMKYEQEFLEKTKFRSYNESLVPLIEAAKELEHSMADAYAVNKVRQAYKHIEETWEDVRARCS